MHVTERQACEAELADLREVITHIMPIPEGNLLDNVAQIVARMHHIERELQYSRACTTRCAAHLQPWLESRSTPAPPSTRGQEKLLAAHVADLLAELHDKEAELADLRQHEAQMVQYLHSLATTMAESAQIIPVLNAQLGDVTDQTETAAVGLGESFSNITTRVNTDLAHTRTLFGAFIL